MKTQIATIFTALVLTTGIATSTYAVSAKTQNATVLNDISAINKIEVHGNVQLYISDAPSDEVKVYNKYYSETALVQNKDGVLRITSYNAEKLVVWVKASDLHSVSAYDNSDVKSFGDIAKIDFNVDLHDNAAAQIKLDAYAANVKVNDFAKADLSGNVNEFSLNQSVGSSINRTGLATVHYTENKFIIADAKLDDIAEL